MRTHSKKMLTARAACPHHVDDRGDTELGVGVHDLVQEGGHRLHLVHAVGGQVLLLEQVAAQHGLLAGCVAQPTQVEANLLLTVLALVALPNDGVDTAGVALDPCKSETQKC
jgi:hypothetical protein